MRVTTTWRNDNPNTIWNVLARRLGREPTAQEVRDELRRISNESLIERAEQGKLRHQHGW